MKKTIFLLFVAVALGVFLWYSERPAPTTVFTNPPAATPTPSPTPQADPRVTNLTTFFIARRCPEVNISLIYDYLAAADKYNLDYRLLPAISLQESSCLQHYPVDSFNPWGWNSARTGFASLQVGIDYISDKLANGYYYAGKTLEQKLTSYNSLQYAKRVEIIMQEIEPNK